MAINDNANYLLKGYQVKDLANKIKATEYEFGEGLVKEGKEVSLGDIITVNYASWPNNDPWLILKDETVNQNDFWIKTGTKDNLPVLKFEDSPGSSIDVPITNYVDGKIANCYTKSETYSKTEVDDAIDRVVMTDIGVQTTPSTTDVVLTGDKVNLKTGVASDKNVPLPVASATQAGVINTATYQSILDSAERIEAMEGGAVAINGLPANPTQAELTAAWKSETGQTDLINDASILDVDNDLRWTYYTNTNTWYSAGTSTPVVINHFTNNEAGTIKGSSVDGQVHAETDGTGSVQGWDAVKADIANNASAISTKQDKETGKGLSTNDFTDALKSKLEGIPTVNDATLTIQQNGVSVGTFTANSSTPTTANITTPVITMTDTDPGEGVDLPENHYIAVYGVSRDDYSLQEIDTGKKWIDGKTVYRRVFTGTMTNTANTGIRQNIWNASPIDTIVDYSGYYAYGTDGKATIPYTEGSTQNASLYLQSGTGNLVLWFLNSTAMTDREYMICIEYTKKSS